MTKCEQVILTNTQAVVQIQHDQIAKMRHDLANEKFAAEMLYQANLSLNEKLKEATK